jgi:hypothetical protein
MKKQKYEKNKSYGANIDGFGIYAGAGWWEAFDKAVEEHMRDQVKTYSKKPKKLGADLKSKS